MYAAAVDSRVPRSECLNYASLKSLGKLSPNRDARLEGHPEDANRGASVRCLRSALNTSQAPVMCSRSWEPLLWTHGSPLTQRRALALLNNTVKLSTQAPIPDLQNMSLGRDPSLLTLSRMFPGDLSGSDSGHTNLVSPTE